MYVTNYYMTDLDVTLMDLTYLLITAEATMLWRIGQANLCGRSTSQISMDTGNDNDNSSEMISSPKGRNWPRSKSLIIREMPILR